MTSEYSNPNDSSSSSIEITESRYEVLEQVIDLAVSGQSIDKLVEVYPKHADEIRKHYQGIFETSLKPPTPDSGLELPLPFKFGDYELVEEIGRGGMGVVYLAQRHDLNTKYAVKVFDLAEKRIQKFESYRMEAEIVAKLHHPNIVPLVDFGKQDNFVYLVMRIVNGPSLAEFARSFHETNKLDESKDKWKFLTHILMQVGYAVQHAHRSNVIHRDIKPGNILLDENSNAWLTDFGLSSKASRSSLRGGTRGYMSPEQKAGMFGAQTDVYSFGISMFEVLSGVRKNGARFLELAPDGLLNLATLEKHFPQIPNELARIIAKATQLSREKRYLDMTEVLRDMEKFIAIEPPRKTNRTLLLTGITLIACVSLIQWFLQKTNDPTSPNTPAVFPARLTEEPIQINVCEQWNSTPLFGLDAIDAENDPIQYNVTGEDKKYFRFDNVLSELVFDRLASAPKRSFEIELAVSGKRKLNGFYVGKEGNRIAIFDFHGRRIRQLNAQDWDTWINLVGVASKDGKTIFRAIRNGSKIELQTSTATGVGQLGVFETVNEDCKLPKSTEAIETLNGNLFYVFYKTEIPIHNGHVRNLQIMELKENGEFVNVDKPVRLPIIHEIKQARISGDNSLTVVCRKPPTFPSTRPESQAFSISLNRMMNNSEVVFQRIQVGRNNELEGTSWFVEDPASVESSINITINTISQAHWPVPVNSKVSSPQNGTVTFANYSQHPIFIAASNASEDFIEWPGVIADVVSIRPGDSIELRRFPGMVREIYGPNNQLWETLIDEDELDVVHVEGPNEISSHDQDANPRLRRAIARIIESGQTTRPEMALRTYLQKYPNDSGALKLLAYCQLHDFNLSDAQTTAERLIQQTPNSCLALELNGEIQRHSKNFSVAKNHFQTIIASCPDSPAGELGLSRIAMQQDDASAAVMHAQKAYKRFPSDLLTAHHLWRLHDRIGNSKQTDFFKKLVDKLQSTQVSYTKNYVNLNGKYGLPVHDLKSNRYVKTFAIHRLWAITRSPENTPLLPKKPTLESTSPSLEN